jgi:hypothetical protein
LLEKDGEGGEDGEGGGYRRTALPPALGELNRTPEPWPKRSSSARSRM